MPSRDEGSGRRFAAAKSGRVVRLADIPESWDRRQLPAGRYGAGGGH